jgi:hypothetical protein
MRHDHSVDPATAGAIVVGLTVESGRFSGFNSRTWTAPVCTPQLPTRYPTGLLACRSDVGRAGRMGPEKLGISGLVISIATSLALFDASELVSER